MTTTVLYVGGTGRSGSTVLANLLGEVAGYVSVGELRYIWERGMHEDRLCGCGRRFSECPFWQQVLDTAFPDQRPDAQAMARRQQAATRLRALPVAIAGSRRGRPGGDGALSDGALSDALGRVYAAVGAVSGARVVVDSSKLPSYAALLDGLPGVDVRVLHLVRDPRAAAFSWRRTKVQPDRRTFGYMERRGAAKSVALWVAWNAALEALWRRNPERYLRLSYEEVMSRPQAALEQVVDFVGLGGDAAAPFVDPHTARFGANHTVAGNPSRLRSGAVPLRLDNEWRASMPARDRILVAAAAAPLMSRYGYPVRAKVGAGGMG
jgi:Sulfotransferase family